MSPVGLTATAPSRVTAKVPTLLVQPEPYELLKHVKAFALDILRVTPMIVTTNASFFMMSAFF